MLRRRLRRLLLLGAALLAASPSALQAERLPITPYGTAEGLPSTFLEHVTRDSRGFIWFSTRDGLSRFDGLRFVTYGIEHGLPNPTINFLIESRTGAYWVATNGGGICRMDPSAPLLPPGPPSNTLPSNTPPATPSATPQESGAGALFTCFEVSPSRLSNQVNALYEDRRGRLWMGSDDGLFRMDRAPARGEARASIKPVPLGLPGGRIPGIHYINEDPHGAIWIGCVWGLVRIGPDGGRVVFSLRPTPGGDNIYSLLVDAQGRLWIGHQAGLAIMKPPASMQGTISGPAATRSFAEHPNGFLETTVRLPEREGEVRWYLARNGKVDLVVHALQETTDGHIWLGTNFGLIEIDGARVRRYTTADGLSDALAHSLTTDAEDNLWAATQADGAMKLTRKGFHSFDTRDGLGDPRIHSIFEDHAGVLSVVSGGWFINRFDGQRFAAMQPRVPSIQPLWASQAAFLDDEDRWWLMMPGELVQLPPGSQSERLATAAQTVVHPQASATRLYQDRQGDIWIGRRYAHDAPLMTWRRATGALQIWTPSDSLPRESTTAFVEDGAGQLWIGLANGELIRHVNGHFTRFPAPRGPGGIITSLCRDEEGRIWAGSNRDGLIRIDAPDSPQPRFTVYSKANGLGSNNVRSVVADRFGRVYAGTARGVDRIDPRTNRIEHYTTGDGLTSGFVGAAYRDRTGALWFGSLKGLSRLIPEPSERRDPPPVFIGAVRAAGVPYGVAHLGQRDVSGLTLRPGEGQLQIEFFGLAFGMGESLRYQYRLDGADDRGRWTDVTEERTVHYSRLPPRGYRFQVRAVRADGTTSAQAATVSFSVLPALWQRAWFQAIILALAAGAAYAAYRLRMSRLLALERVRSRIAGDLHDDIGATLAQIAVLSEVVQTQIDDAHAPLRAPVSRIAQTAREAIASMSDIVWAINPQKDSLHEMVRRMRRFASEVLPPRGITFRIVAPEEDARLGADVRRHVYLIFKEALNNILRHAECTEVEITLRLAHRRLELQIVDNGRGFDTAGGADGVPGGTAVGSEGNGLISMSRRAEALGGALNIESGHGRPGTAVTARIPLSRAA